MTPASDSPSRLLRGIGLLAAVVLGIVLLVAAWGKAIDPEAFVQQIQAEGLDFFGLATAVALAAIVLEVALGMALVLGMRRLWILLPTTALVVFFLFLTGRAYWKFEQGLIDSSEACGCFGNLVTRTPAQAFWQDLLLLGVPLLLAFVARPRAQAALPKWRVTAVIAVTLAAVGLSLAAPALPLDNLATRLSPGVEVTEICAGAEEDPERICLDGLVTELERGRHLVVMSGLDEEDFLNAVSSLNERAVAGGDLGLWVLTSAAEDTVSTFHWTQAPAFEVREAPLALLRPLYRTLPRSFLIEEGVVLETYSGLPPESV